MFKIYKVKKLERQKIIDYMALVTRTGKIVWDDKNNELPGTIYENYINDLGKNEKNTNNFLMAMSTNKKEMVGIKEDIGELRNLKQEIMYIAPQIFNNNLKKM